LEILEYCGPDQCLIREKYYLDLLQPEYNLSLDPTASFAGRKHSEKTKQILSDAKKGENNPNFGKTLSDETRQQISDTAKKIDHSGRFKKGENHPNHGKPRIEGAGSPSQGIEVTDSTNNTTTSYNSIREAARALNINQTIIVKYFVRNQQKPYKGQYTFKKL
jgi:group I intron endonuclease